MPLSQIGGWKNPVYLRKMKRACQTYMRTKKFVEIIAINGFKITKNAILKCP